VETVSPTPIVIQQPVPTLESPVTPAKQAVALATSPTSPIALAPTTPQTTTQTTPAATQQTALAASLSVAPNSTPAASTSTSGSNEKPKAKLGGVQLVLSLNLVEKNAIKQYNPFPVESMSQPMPAEMMMRNQVMMDMLAVAPIEQQQLKEDLDLTQ
jgi:hypothetical protein